MAQSEKAKLRQEQSRKESGVVTANDTQEKELEVKRQAARESGKYRTARQQIYSRATPALGKLDEVQSGVAMATPVASTIYFTDQAGKGVESAVQGIKHGLYLPAAGDLLQAAGNTALGVVSLIPGVGLVRELKKQKPVSTNSAKMSEIKLNNPEHIIENYNYSDIEGIEPLYEIYPDKFNVSLSEEGKALYDKILNSPEHLAYVLDYETNPKRSYHSGIGYLDRYNFESHPDINLADAFIYGTESGNGSFVSDYATKYGLPIKRDPRLVISHGNNIIYTRNPNGIQGITASGVVEDPFPQILPFKQGGTISYLDYINN